MAQESRQDRPAPPDGPKALDRFMERAVRQQAQAAGRRGTGKARPHADAAPRPGEDEIAAFYARLVNSDRCLPPSMISNTMRDAMLARGLVTVERLRERGVQ